MVEATIEALASPSVLRGYLTQKRTEDGAAVLSTTLPGDTCFKQMREQKIKRNGGYRGAEFSTAERDGKGMALKRLTGARPFPKAAIEPLEIMEKKLLF